MNVLLVVIDSLRKKSVTPSNAPFLTRLAASGRSYTQAFSSDCWTLPSHVSMFTGLTSLEHGAGFPNMNYRGGTPTIATRLRDRGFATACITRNPVFDGSILGIMDGFTVRQRPIAPGSPWATIPFMLAKPRVQRHLAEAGHLTPWQKNSREFLGDLLRLATPSDELALDRALVHLRRFRRSRQDHFVFLNLYDVHLPYPPTPTAPHYPLTTLHGIREYLTTFPLLMSIIRHDHTREGFAASPAARDALRDRYHRAIRCLDAKLDAFFTTADGEGLLDDTAVIVTSDHGEAFGEHGLFGHDTSVWNTHLHVPLIARIPGQTRGTDLAPISTRQLADMIARLAGGDYPERARLPVVAHHRYHRGITGMKPELRRDLEARWLPGGMKVIDDGTTARYFATRDDPSELRPTQVQQSWRKW